MLCVLVAFVGGKVPYAHSAEDCAREVARVVSVEGGVHLRSAHGETWRAAESGAVLCAGDQVRVGARSRAALVLHNETTLRLDQSSTLTLREGGLDGSSLLDLLSGALHVITRTPQPFKVKTPYVNAAVDGTEFLVDVSPDEARIAVYEGRVSASNEFGILSLVAGEIALVAKNQAPRKEIMVRPVDAVQWALYYPNIIDYRLDDVVRGSTAAPALRESIDLYRQGRLAEAIFRTDHAPEGRNDARFLTYRAGLLLTVGRVDEAKPEIQHAIALNPHFSPALALDSVIAVVQNDKEQALTLATKAVEFDPASPAARMALSYAQQAHFKIEEASASVLKALELEPNSALAWARLAELQMSSGELDLALKSAQRAVQLDPGIAKTQSVLGFAHLTRFDTKAAKEAFGKAVELDQAEPLARLGLGLAKIREGDLSAGREEIEIAVSLDPGNSLIRSYMGKAYYEEKRDKLAGGQFELAKRYDPRDPTPWFYDAIRKQTENRPLEALRDVEESIALNDNRAIYRSRLLLDQDLAARSASLAGIYSDLRFDRIALVEGYKSLSQDPGNYSAHRFLADAFATRPRHKIAQLSELLQSQLLQPINISPLQPQLAESRLLVLEGAGPANASSYEFNHLFARDRLVFQATGRTGSRNTSGHDAAIAGIQGPLSYSVGEFHYDTDGFRENNDLNQDIVSMFAQARVSPLTNVQVEVRRRTQEHGDLSILFEPHNFSRVFRETQAADTARLGIHQLFSPASEVVGSLIHQSIDITQRDLNQGIEGTKLEIRRRREGYLVDLQHLYRGERINLVSGIGHFSQDVKQTTAGTAIGTVTIFRRVPFLPFPIPVRISLLVPFTLPTVDDNHRYSEAYSYAQFRPFSSLFLTAGLSADDYKIGEQLDRRRMNPKLGVVWEPTAATTIRAAAFRSTSRTLTFNQIVEPTQVAGFNQFFDDLDGTSAWRYGGAVDQKFSRRLFGGMEISRRRLEVPLFTAAERARASFLDWNEDTSYAYIYWTIGSSAALSAEFQHDRFTRDRRIVDPAINQGIVNVGTQQLRLGVTFLGPNDLTFRLGGSSVLQSGDFSRRAIGSSEGEVFSGRDRFFIVDADLEYRLPRRLGTVRVGAKNLFDQEFNYVEPDPANPQLARRRFVWAEFSLAF